MTRNANARRNEQVMKSVDNLAAMIGERTGLRAEMLFERLVGMSLEHNNL